jgi:hypothetical protein
MSHKKHRFALDASMPSCSLVWLFEQIHLHLINIRDENSEVFSPNQFAALAATIQTLVNGAIPLACLHANYGSRPTKNDSELCLVRNMILNPSKICDESLSKYNHNYCMPLQQSLLSIEDGLLIMKEPITGSDSYMHLQLVPREFYNIIFIAFHANPVGVHLNLVQTLHRIRLPFYWPLMFGYVKRMCIACPGCALSNPTHGKSSKLVYRFPIKAPFLVMHFNAYSAGKHSRFKGSVVYLIGCRVMCGFACMEPNTNPLATTFASAVMEIRLQYGFCHTAVLDKDSKIFGVCRKAMDLLLINSMCYLVETITQCLWRGLIAISTKALKSYPTNAS